jgi:hypothetical protein
METIPMSLSIGRRVLLACCAVAAGAMTFWACETPVSVGAEVRAGPYTGKLTFNSNGEPVAEIRGPVGTCIKLTYSGADGADISTAVVQIPGASQVPEGSVRVSIDIVPCPTPAQAAPTAGVVGVHALPFHAWHEVYSFPATPGVGSSNGAMCHARVWCGADENAAAILSPILRAGPGVAVPPNIRILSFADARPSLVGATIRAAAQEPILDMSLEWNGVANYADLATGVNVVPQSLPNGWYSVESFIPNSDIDESIGALNRAAMSIATLLQPSPEQYSLSYRVLGY